MQQLPALPHGFDLCIELMELERLGSGAHGRQVDWILILKIISYQLFI